MRRLAKGPKTTGSTQMFMRNRKSCNTPSPVPLRMFEMLLVTKGVSKNQRVYPTISMIISGLLANLSLALHYFQYDSLWKSVEATSNTDRTHDLYDRKGVGLETRKAAPLFTIVYRRGNDAGFAIFGVEATIFMVKKELRWNRHSSASFYVVEKRPRSALALKRTAFETHDVYEAQSLILNGPFFETWRATIFARLLIASSLAIVRPKKASAPSMRSPNHLQVLVENGKPNA
jgi:hypothetical protein